MIWQVRRALPLVDLLLSVDSRVSATRVFASHRLLSVYGPRRLLGSPRAPPGARAQPASALVVASILDTSLAVVSAACGFRQLSSDRRAARCTVAAVRPI